MYRVYNKSSRLVEESSNVEFDEHNGSQVGQSDLIVVDDEIPPPSIRRMGVGQILPIEEPLGWKDKDNALLMWSHHILKINN